jgi:hypothetical protein
MRWSLFAETKFTEYLINDFFIGGFAYDLAKGLQATIEI